MSEFTFEKLKTADKKTADVTIYQNGMVRFSRQAIETYGIFDTDIFMGRKPGQNRAGDAEGKPRQNLTREKERYHQLPNADSETVCRQIFSEKNWGTAGAGTRPERGGIKDGKI